MTYETTQLVSNYRSLPITVAQSVENRPSESAILLHPGAFEFLWGDNARYKRILTWLGEHCKERPQCFSYETSRNALTREKEEDNSHYWQRLFAGKTFYNELDDVTNVLSYISSYEHIQRIYTIGFSLGGTLSLLLAQKFPKVKKICLIGSAISTKRVTLPVLTGYPSKNEIKKIIETFNLSLLYLQGFAEEVVPFDDALEVIQTIKHAQYASLVRIARANHMFSEENEYGFIHGEKLLEIIRTYLEVDYD